uniref:Uncharacterized protein n=1 Tax=Salmonella sp. TaxID=599 RepID=A0A482ETJ7_SALSP|nr:hypothetical protein NNIBIDOC_00101 [Salmonella sp.]
MAGRYRSSHASLWFSENKSYSRTITSNSPPTASLIMWVITPKTLLPDVTNGYLLVTPLSSVAKILRCWRGRAGIAFTRYSPPISSEPSTGVSEGTTTSKANLCNIQW